MNFKQFDRLLAKASYDEVQIIGKDVTLDGHFAHIIGMTRKDKQVLVYTLELTEQSEEEETFSSLTDQIHRQQMKKNYKQEINHAFLGIEEFHSNGKVSMVTGATSSQTEPEEHMLFYLKMKEHGWTMSNDSPLYTVGWNRLQLSVIELEEMDALPDWKTDLKIVKRSQPKTVPLEQAILLTCGEQPVISFHLEDGTPATCYINKIALYDVWAEQERKLEDEKYKKRMLEHVSMEEFQKMQKNLEEALLADCPREKCYMLVEYECNPDVCLNFYATSFLDSKPQVHSGNATSLLIMHRPDNATGSHGLKARGCVIQTPISPEKTSLKAELFSYTETIQQRTETLYETTSD